MRPGGFAAVVGNPPFLNAIETPRSSPLRALFRRTFPDLRGATDAAYLFLALASSLRRDGGRVGMIQPRAVLNAPAMLRWRARHTRGDVSLLFAPDDARLFPGAHVHVALIGLGRTDVCALGRGTDPVHVRWTHAPVTDDNWWRALRADDAAPCTNAPTLGERFTLRASMTAGDAYKLVPLLSDTVDGDGLALVTTGLIDRERCAWGLRPCRYLKRDYGHPRVQDSPAASPSLRRRILDARRPKLLVAGLSAKVECVLDERGEYIGAVSTYTITHPADDIPALRALMHHLHTDDVSARLRAELGGSALSGGNITLTKAWLSRLPLDLGAITPQPPAP